MHSTTGRGRDCQSLHSAVLANKESASTRSAISVPQGWGLIRTEFSVGTGIEEYLILLSVCQTCKYSGLDFLDFLRSGEKDIGVFAESQQNQRGRHRAPITLPS